MGYCNNARFWDDEPCPKPLCKHDTRLHTPAPTAEFTDAENKWCDDYATAYNRGFDAGAKAAREQVLEMLIKAKESQGKHDGYAGVVLDPIIESLRSTQQQAGDQHESTAAKEE